MKPPIVGLAYLRQPANIVTAGCGTKELGTHIGRHVDFIGQFYGEPGTGRYVAG